MANFVKHTSCPNCGSKDNLAIYDDNSYHCFSNCGTVTHIGNFKTVEQCQHVLKNIPTNNFSGSCIQAEVIK